MTTFDTRTAKSIDIRFYLRDEFNLVITVTDEDDAAVDLSGKTLVFSIRESDGGAAISTIDGTSITVSGTGNNTVTLTKVLTGLSEKSYYYDLDNTTDNETIMDGKFIANYKGR